MMIKREGILWQMILMVFLIEGYNDLGNHKLIMISVMAICL